MCPSIVQPGIEPGAAMAPLVATGLNPSPSAQSVASKSLITAVRIRLNGSESKPTSYYATTIAADDLNLRANSTA